jgi:oxysterol-binding protein-related protein 9/10/11
MHWDVAPISYDPDDRVPIITHHVDPPSNSQLTHNDSGGIKAAKASSKYGRVGPFGSLLSMKGWSSPAVDRPLSTVVESNVSAQLSDLSLASTHTGESGSGSGSASASTSSPPTSMSTTAGTLRVAYLTEQISHHPPISAYVATCPTRHITLSGIDQISVRVLPSASLRVSSGAMNKGLFVTIDGGPGAGERYQITHPVAHVNGVLRGSFYATVQESTIVTCTGGPGVGKGEMLRAIVEYKEEVTSSLWLINFAHLKNAGSLRAGSANHTLRLRA